MDKPSMSTQDIQDPEFFINAKDSIEKELCKLKKVVNNINQMRVEASYLESDLLLLIDCGAWEQISELMRPTPKKFEDISLLGDAN